MSQEAKEGVNTGAFFIRNVPWAYWWMDKWWAFSKDIPDFAWNDQLALWYAPCPPPYGLVRGTVVADTGMPVPSRVALVSALPSRLLCPSLCGSMTGALCGALVSRVQSWPCRFVPLCSCRGCVVCAPVGGVGDMAAAVASR